MNTIGLTGGIGSGKTTVAHILEELGAHVIHADQVGHEVYRRGSPASRRIVAEFGDGIMDTVGAVDRKRLGAIVFADPSALARLNAIVHPLMRDEIRQRIEGYRAANPARPVVLEAAILIEADWVPLVDQVWLVVASKAAVIERVRAERGLSPEEVEARLRAQLSDDERRRVADVVIENTGSLELLRDRVQAAWDSARTDG